MKSPSKRLLASQTIGDAETDIVEKLVGKLAAAAAGKVGEAAAGWILQAVGIDTGGDQQELKRIEDELAVQTAMLKTILMSITKLEQEIKAAVNEIKDAIDRSEYNTAVRILNDQVASIQGLQERLKVKGVLIPNPAHRADVKHLRDDILSNVPTALYAINDTMMGVASAEGVYSLWSRLSFKHSDTLSDYAKKVNQQFIFYYTLQVQALQLMLEAYHSADPPEVDEAKQYYIDWKTKIVAQLAEYRKTAARTSIDRVLPVNGPVYDMASTAENVYVCTKGSVHSFKTSDGTASGSLTTDLESAELRIVGDSILIVGMVPDNTMTAYNVLKASTVGGLTLQGKTTVHCVRSGSPLLLLLVSGLAADSDNLYLLTMELGIEGYKIQVVDIETMTLKPELEYACTEGIQGMGGLAIVGTTAIMPGYYNGSGDTLTTVDLSTRQILAKLPLPKTGHGGPGDLGASPIRVSDGVAIFSQMNYDVWVADVRNPNHPKLLQTANFDNYLHSLDTDGHLSYFSAGQQYGNPGGLHCIYRSQYQEALSKPWDIGSNITALQVAGDYLYVGSPPSVANGNVWVIGFTCPIATPPDPSG